MIIMTKNISRQETRVLILSMDDYGYRQLLRESLEQNGYRDIRGCTNGNDAIRLAREYKPHVILMRTKLSNDWETQPENPKTHGYVACREIRRQDYGKDIAIIGMSALGSFYREKWVGAGADDFVNYPPLKWRAS